MNLNVKKAIVVILAAVYCFGIGVITKSFSHTYNDYTQSSAAESYIADISANLFCHTTQTESSVDGLNKLQNQNVKNSFGENWMSFTTTNQLFFTCFTQLNRNSTNLRISQRNTDFIFPFHYFL